MTTAPTPDRLPCPFCGSAKVTAKNEHTDLSGGYYIECSACLACAGLRYACGEDPRPLLAELWNRRAELEARKPLPLSDEQIEGLREQTFSTNNPFCPCDSKTMRKAVRAAERAHGIKEP
ncbi:Lar family restriction alleviation protein [Delftia acidovorans]